MTEYTDQLQVRQSDGVWEFRVVRGDTEIARSGGYTTEQEAINAGFSFMGMDIGWE